MRIVHRQSPKRPKVSTASLPDIIFILLFFFMVVTVIRQQDRLLQIELPKVDQTEQLVHRSLVHHIRVGEPIDSKWGTAPRVQINDRIVTLEHIGQFVYHVQSNTPVDLQGRLTTSLKIDRGITMGIVNDVKTELRKADQLKINYASLDGDPLD
ncbi:MAG: biopolymer transporter ExbD [Bacteroidota bacterium]